jgi:hypothetical protein
VKWEKQYEIRALGYYKVGKYLNMIAAIVQYIFKGAFLRGSLRLLSRKSHGSER